MCHLNCNDYRFFPPMAKTIIVTCNTGSKGKKSCQTEAVWSSLDKTLINYLNWDWFVSKLWQDQLRQTTFAGEVGPVAFPRRTHAITGYYVVTMGTHSRRRSTRNRLFLAIGRGLTLPTSTVRLEMFSSIQSTIDSLVYRWWQRDFWTEHFFGLGPTDYLSYKRRTSVHCCLGVSRVTVHRRRRDLGVEESLYTSSRFSDTGWPPLDLSFWSFEFFAPWYRKSRDAFSVKILQKKIKGKVGQMCFRSCSLA